MVLNLLKASIIAAAAHSPAAIIKTVIAMSTIQSTPTNIERAATWQTYVFVGYVFLLLLTLAGTVLLYKAGNAYQEAVKSDADARIAEAQGGAAKAVAGVANATLEIEKAKEETAKANAEAAKANEG